MANKLFTNETLTSLVNHIKAYVDKAVASKADATAVAYFDKNDNETVILTADLEKLSELGDLIGGDA